MSPSEVKACSWWEFEAAVAGWIAANTPEDQQALSKDDEDALWQGVIERMG